MQRKNKIITQELIIEKMLHLDLTVTSPSSAPLLGVEVYQCYFFQWDNN